METEALVRRESILNAFGSLLVILPLLFLVFRSVWLVVVGALPAALSLLVVLGGFGFLGSRLSAAGTGASAMLFGLGIDGVVLLYVAHLRPVEGGPDTSSRIAGPAASMVLGMWTTAATFYGLAFVNFPSLQQLGLLVGHSMLICGILTLVVVPALLPRRAHRDELRQAELAKVTAMGPRTSPGDSGHRGRLDRRVRVRDDTSACQPQRRATSVRDRGVQGLRLRSELRSDCRPIPMSSSLTEPTLTLFSLPMSA